MHSIWNFFLHKRQFTWLTMLALTLAGIYSVTAISKESSPEVIIPIGIVSTVFPGASPKDVEELVTNKIEDAIANVDNVKKVTSTSQSGVSIVTAEFNANANVDRSIDDLKNAVDTAVGELPEDATDPSVIKVNFADQPILVLSITSDALPVEFTKLAKDVERELENVAGISKVDVSGARAREVQVVLRPEALESRGVSLPEVIQGIAASNASLPIGSIRTGAVDYSLQFDGSLANPEEVRAIAIPTQGGSVLLRDIATISTGVEPERAISRVALEGKDPENAITFNVYKRAGGDVTSIANAVKSRLTELQQPGNLLDRSQVFISLDTGAQVQQDLRNLIEAGLETVLLVMASLLLTIGWRESIVAALSIPLSFVIAFTGLLVSGNTINFVSLFSLILAVGILVDSGIVVTEAIHTRMRDGLSPDDAATKALKEYAWPLIGGTMTTVAVFAPLFFISGVVGKFIASIPFTIIFVLLASIVVALGFVPLIALKLTKPGSANRLEEKQEEWTHRAQQWYRAHLHAFLLNQKAQNVFLLSLVAGLVVAFSLPVLGVVKTTFFPGENVNFVYLDIETKRGTPLTETNNAVREVERIVAEKPYVKAFTSTAGSASLFTSGGGGGGVNGGGIYGNITLELYKEREQSSDEIIEELRTEFTKFTSADIRILGEQNGPPSGAPVLIKFAGDDLGELAKLADRAEGILKSIPGTVDVVPSTKNIGTEFVFDIDAAKASELGLSPRSVAQLLRTAVFGSAVTTIRSEGDDIDVVVKLALDPRYTDPTDTTNVTPDALKNISISTPRGSVLLGTVLSDRLSTSNAAIIHENGRRIESVSSQLTPDTTATEIVAAFTAREPELQMPSDVTITYGGETEDVNRSFTEMFFALIAGLVLMLAILVLAFNSVRYSLYLLATVPLSLIGVFAGLALMREPLSFTSLLGVVALAGVIINHAIILMDSLLVYSRTQTKEALIDSVVFASTTRLRPIFLTTITTVLGMIPLSRISDFWSPLAYAIMYGLTFAMILTLILIPTLFYRHKNGDYLWMRRFGKNLFWHWPRRFFSFIWSLFSGYFATN